jgi:hypothetical protein
MNSQGPGKPYIVGGEKVYMHRERYPLSPSERQTIQPQGPGKPYIVGGGKVYMHMERYPKRYPLGKSDRQTISTSVAARINSEPEHTSHVRTNIMRFAGSVVLVVLLVGGLRAMIKTN